MTDYEKRLVDYVYGKLQDIMEFCEKNNVEKVRIYADCISKGAMDGVDWYWLSVNCILPEDGREKVIERTAPHTGDGPIYSLWYREVTNEKSDS